MKILLTIKNLNFPGGGAERVFVDVANGLLGRSHDVRVLTFDLPGGSSSYPLDPAIERTDTGVSPEPRQLGFARLAKDARHLRRRILALRPDVVVAFMHSTCVPVTLAIAGSGIPVVFSEHIDLAHYRGRVLQRGLRRLIDTLVVAKTVPSQAVRNEFSEAQRRRVTVVPNPVAVDDFRLGTSRPAARPPILLAVGTFRAQKNHAELVRAFARVSPTFPDWTLRIVGDGVKRPEIEKEIAVSRMGDRVVLPGTTRDVAREYADASIVALPSLYESFGLVAAEALASARPVISFAHCLGVAELIQNERNGLLVSGAHAEARVHNLAQGLERLMSDPELRDRLGQAGPASVSRFRLPEVLDQWETLLRRITGQDAGGQNAMGMSGRETENDEC